MADKITKELLKEWNACIDGFKRFCELFPDGADLESAIKGLVDDGRDSWGRWLFDKSKENNLFLDVVQRGPQLWELQLRGPQLWELQLRELQLWIF